MLREKFTIETIALAGPKHCTSVSSGSVRSDASSLSMDGESRACPVRCGSVVICTAVAALVVFNTFMYRSSNAAVVGYTSSRPLKHTCVANCTLHRS